MTVFPGLVRRAAHEAERRLRAGVDLLAAIAGDPGRTAEADRLTAQETRIRRLEEALARRDRDLEALRTDLDSLVAQLNERLLPRIDERMDDTERDLTALVTGLIRSGRETAAARSQLETIENRVSDLRGRLARMEQRAGLWRDLQATMARLGDDVDALRSRLNVRPADAPTSLPDRIGEPATPRLNGTDAHSQAS